MVGRLMDWQADSDGGSSVHVYDDGLRLMDCV